jgi:hypothetical protein
MLKAKQSLRQADASLSDFLIRWPVHSEVEINGLSSVAFHPGIASQNRMGSLFCGHQVQNLLFEFKSRHSRTVCSFVARVSTVC